jgi:hypothetical protein
VNGCGFELQWLPDLLNCFAYSMRVHFAVPSYTVSLHCSCMVLASRIPRADALPPPGSRAVSVPHLQQRQHPCCFTRFTDHYSTYHSSSRLKPNRCMLLHMSQPRLHKNTLFLYCITWILHRPYSKHHSSVELNSHYLTVVIAYTAISKGWCIIACFMVTAQEWVNRSQYEEWCLLGCYAMWLL